MAGWPGYTTPTPRGNPVTTTERPPLLEPRASQPYYPQVHVNLTGHDQTVFHLVAHVAGCMRKAGVLQEQIEAFATDAMNVAPGQVHAVVQRWVEVS